MNYR
ncbi:rCG60674 [Rattus norvegicus]